jgi:transcriptional regulator with XRE-family HTH domain
VNAPYAPDVAPIGAQLRRIRSERGLTQEALAERSGVSVDLVKKLEQGKRASARLTTLIALANALDVTLSQLTDKQPQLNGGTDRLLLGLRDAILSPRLLAGLDPEADREPTPLPVLDAALRRAWGAYWAGQFSDLARAVPDLIVEAHATRAHVGTAAASALTQAYQLAACLLVQLGRDEIAATAAERAITAAAAGEDPLQWATVCGTYTWVLLAQGRTGEAEHLAGRVAEQIEPRLSTAQPQQLTVWGGMLLWALAAAAAAGQESAVPEYLSLATAGAARLPRDRHDYEVNFGRTQVAMQATHAWAVLGHPDRALSAAPGVDRSDLQTISYGRHLIDLAQAHADASKDGQAVTVLHEAADLAPVWFRNQGSARTLVGEVRRRHHHPSAALRSLISRLGPAEGHNTAHI